MFFPEQAESSDTFPARNYCIDTLLAYQKNIRFLQARISQTLERPQHTILKYEGDLMYKSPGTIALHYHYPADESIFINDSQLILYPAGKKIAYRYQRNHLSAQEKRMVDQAVQVQRNLLASMAQGYTFVVAETISNQRIRIEATPVQGWKSLSRISIAANPQLQSVESISIYEKGGALVLQNTYNDFFVDKEHKALFPKFIEQKSMVTGGYEKITTKFSRIKCNEISDTTFAFQPPKDVIIYDSAPDSQK